MLSAFANVLKVPELRARIIFTLIVVIIVRVGAQITTPGVNAAVLHHWFLDQVNNQSTGSVAALFNIFSGGALENCALFSLGIMPYISASIILQIMSTVIPQLAKMQKEDGGRQKISQFTRYLTVALCLIQGYLLAKSFENPAGSMNMLNGIGATIQKMGVDLVASKGFGFEVITVISLTAGTMLLMWLGDQITERGIGNGDLAHHHDWHRGATACRPDPGVAHLRPGQWRARHEPPDPGVHGGVLHHGHRGDHHPDAGAAKISVQYARRIVGRKEYRGGTQTLPLKLNYAGVMPIIFGQALLLFPATIVNLLFKNSRTAQEIAQSLTSGWAHYVFYGLMIFFFSYFWVAMMFQPSQIADELKKNGGYIPGVRPGKPTAEFLDFSMSRLTAAGAIFLVIVATLPQLLSQAMGVPFVTATFFGGTSLLIIVGVLLDTMRQVETHLIQRHYDGFLRRGKLPGGRYNALSPVKAGEPARQSTMVMLCVGAALLLIGGLALYLNH